ncbi:auxilin-like protein 1 [Benincasa hispida]|uniref:auxilin-like protein 1 n=1 Tax=Benincasa hispida TaxID=102211 RepID=UPI0018FFAD66|nr:auxilin-like protein 1 [Benincasa hispida]
MEYRASSTIYKKFSNARSFNDKSAYDGVFATPSKHGAPVFSARVEDYREIFGGSRVSSIPILDVPALSDKKFPVDVRTSKVEYSKIFGGFDELNFAIPYEELLAEANKTNSFSQKTRISAGRGSTAAESSSQYEKGSNFSTREASSQPLDRMEKFSVSYQKINQGNKSYATETAHVALPHAIPGFSCLIDEHSPVQLSGTGMPTSEKLNSIRPESIGSTEVADRPELPISGDSEQAFKSSNPTNSQTRTGWFRSDSADKLFNGYEVDQGVQNPDTPPKYNFLPKFGISEGFSGRKTGLKSEAFGHSEDPCDGSSPPYFGEDVEVNPVAAASVAALRKAIDAAQESIKFAKESMERRKTAGLQKHKKKRSSRSLNSEERREVKASNNSGTCQEKVAGGTCGKVDTLAQAVAEIRGQNSCTECPITQSAVRENLNASGTNYMEFKMTEVDCREEEGEELDVKEQFYEPRSFGEDEPEEMEPVKEDNGDGYEWQGNNELKKTFENPGEYGDSLVGVKEARPEESGINLSVVKDILMSKLKSVLGVVEQEKDKMNYGQNQDQLETNMKAEASMEHEKCVELLEEHKVTKEHEEFVIREMEEKNDMETQVNAHQLGVEEVRHICQQEEKEMKTNTVQIENNVKKMLDKSNKEERNINRIDDFHDGKDAHDMKETDELKLSNLQENKQDDEMIEGLSFHLYNHEIGQDVLRRINIGECSVQESIVKATLDNLNTESKIELQDGYCKQGEFDKLSEDQKASDFVESMEGVEVITDQLVYQDTDNSTDIAKISFGVVSNESGTITEGDLEDRLPFELSSMAKDMLKCREFRIKMEESYTSPIFIENGIDFGAIDMKLEQKQHDTPANKSSIFCSLGNAEDLAPEFRGMERNIKEIEFSTNKENDDDNSNEEETFRTVNNIEAGNGPSTSEDDKKISEEVMEETVTSIITEASMENYQATIKVEESETDYVLKKEMQLESDENNNRVGSQSGTIEIDSEIIHMIKTSQSSRESEESYHVTEDEMEASDSSDEEMEYAAHLEHLEKVNSPGSSGRKENLADIQQEVSTSQTVTDNEDHQTPTLGEIECNADLRRREAEVESKFNSETAAHDLSQAKEVVEELVENLMNQSILETENHQATHLMEEEKVFHEKFEKEAEVIKERQKKIDEAKEKERERERLAVERAIREARERAFVEARERAAAGRASADTRRRVMPEARERSGKVSIEANHKPSVEKVSKEAKLKAQRAAVEMATSEARERALEKAMSEKAISEARNLADKIVAEKLHGATGESKIKKSFSFSDSQPKGPCSSNNFRHANSFNLGGPDSSEREVGSSGESAQRCKARLERHQRTVERVAKALAEKNIRDILAQKEQEERNRLAESLDAEVKRWSSGKEGNLRALLSTLQYILGPDSGWQAVPLTDIITAAAVKKAYRRATLSVHPDKLQQRGATIQQKYICEKVFDLLKAAWNRFNVEER